MLQSLPLWGVAGLFVLSAGIVWFAGSKLATLVDAFSVKTGMGRAFLGMLMLGGITSLPEVAAVGTSSAMGNPALAVNNLLGTASINILLLAVADLVYGRDALTGVAGRPETLMQGVLSMMLALIVAVIATVGDTGLAGIGIGSAVVAAGALGALRIASGFEHSNEWQVPGKVSDRNTGDQVTDRSPKRLGALILLCAVAILVAGFLLSLTADDIASKTGMASGVIGFLLVGGATSLPEISSVSTAVRIKRYQMAVSGIFGTNIFNMMLLLLADIFYRGGPVLAEAGQFEMIGAMLAALMTGIFVIGLLERKDRAIFRMGYDSLAALATFGIGLAVLSRFTG